MIIENKAFELGYILFNTLLWILDGDSNQYFQYRGICILVKPMLVLTRILITQTYVLIRLLLWVAIGITQIPNVAFPTFTKRQKLRLISKNPYAKYGSAYVLI